MAAQQGVNESVDQFGNQAPRELGSSPGVSESINNSIDNLGNVFERDDLQDEVLGSRASDEVIDHEGFALSLSALGGDQKVVFRNGQLSPSPALFYFNEVGEGISELPGGGNNLVKAKIWQDGDILKLELLDTSDFGMDLLGGRVLEYPINAASLDTLSKNRGGSQNIIRAQISSSLNDVISTHGYLGTNNKMLGLDLEQLHSAWSGNHVLDASKTRSHQESKREISDIRYLGYPKGGDSYDFYEVSPGIGNVTVSYSDWSKTMDYTTFALFIMDKGLYPISASEHENIQKKIEEPAPGSVFDSGSLKRITIGTAITMFAEIPEKIKQKFEKNEKLRAAEAEVWMHDKLSFLPGIDKYDAEQKLDNLVWSEIEGRKDQLMGMDTESKSAKSEKKQGVGEVYNDLKGASFGNKEDMRTVAGDFLYVMELNNLYEGSLAEFASDHKWVELLLGPEHYKAFRANFHKKYGSARDVPHNSANRKDALVKMELNYISEVAKEDKQLQRVYGTKFFKSIEDFIEGKMGMQSENVKKDAKNREFNQIYGAAKAQIGKINAGNFVGFLEAGLEKVETHEERSRINLLILQFYTSGASHMSLKLHGDRLEQMGRRYGNPLLKLANNIHAPRIAIHLADAMSGGNTLSGALGLQGEQIEMHTFTHNNSHKSRTKKTAERRNSAGNKTTFMNTLHFSSSRLFRKLGALSKKKNKSDADKLMYEDLKYYYEFAVLGNDGDALTDNDSAPLESPLYADTVLNFTGKGFRDMMLSYNVSNKRFNNPESSKLWRNLTSKIQNMDTQASTASSSIEKEYILHFVTAKFFDFFGGSMSGSSLARFQESLKDGDGAMAALSIEEFVMSKRYYEEASMETGFLTFIDFFKKHAREISRLTRTGSVMPSAFPDGMAKGKNTNYWTKDVKKKLQDLERRNQ